MNTASGIESPKDLVGKNVGELFIYGHDAGVWAKGILSDEYGVPTNGVTYHVGGLDRYAHWDWVPAWIASPARCLAVQTGFDATHGRLAALVPSLTVVDLYGTPGVGGASVERARRLHPPSAPARTALPLDTGTCDAAVAAFALHEIHEPDERGRCFRSLANALAPGGRLLVVEHLRDASNLLAFGPGVFHFLPEREWRRCGDAAGLRLARSAPITPFVRAFLWTKP